MTTPTRVLLLMLFSVVGAFIAYRIAWAEAEGQFVQWRPIAGLPEKAVKIVTVRIPGVWVETRSGRVYEYDYESTPTCGSTCWQTSSVPTPEPTSIFKPEDCGGLPSRSTSIDTQALCMPEGVGNYLIAYSAEKDGTVYSWEFGHGEWDALNLIFDPCLGSILGLGAGLAIFALIKTPVSKSIVNTIEIPTDKNP